MRRHFVMLMLCLSPWPTLANERNDFIDVIRASQQFLAQAKPMEAEAVLLRWEKSHPEVVRDEMFCYQLFFVALEGRGDRATARLMLDRLTLLAEEGTVDPDSNLYLSVTEAWYRAIHFPDSDLPRRSHEIMTARLIH